MKISQNHYQSYQDSSQQTFQVKRKNESRFHQIFKCAIKAKYQNNAILQRFSGELIIMGQVALAITILNASNQFILEPVDKHFSWGRMCDENAALVSINPNTHVKFGVCGRQDGLAGVAGWAKYKIYHQHTGRRFCQFQLEYDEPFDTNRYQRYLRIQLESDPACEYFHFRTEYETRKGHGYGQTEGKFHFQVNQQKIEELKEYLQKPIDWTKIEF